MHGNARPLSDPEASPDGNQPGDDNGFGDH